MARRTSTAWFVIEKPATCASPEEGGNRVVSILMVVVLPAPLEPSKPKTSPALTEKVSASTAVNAPKRRVSVLTSKTMSLIRKLDRSAVSLKRLDQRLTLHSQGGGVWRYGRNLAIDS